jgi:hypothetical protein
MRCRIATLLVLLLVLPFSRGEEKTALVERIIELGKTDGKVMEPLDAMCNQIGPRLTGSSNLLRACETARDLFVKMGIDNARLEMWGTFPVGFDRSPSSGRMVAPEVKDLTFATNAWTAGTVGPVRGPVVLAPKNQAELDAVRGQLRGAWVLQEAQRGRFFGGDGRGRNQGGRRGGGEASPPAPSAPPAPEAGAGPGTAPGPAGEQPGPRPDADREFREALQKAFDEEHIAGVIRPASGELVLTGGNSRISWDKLPTRVTITLVKSQWEDISNRIRNGDEVELEFDIGNHFFQGPVKLYNVVADIPGTDMPNEYVIVGGHIDSWDGAQGTTDNGTGVATTLEAARLLIAAGARPSRTIRFMLWSGEEQGLLGSRAYVKDHPELMDKISAVLVHDFGTNYVSGIEAPPAVRDDLSAVFAPVLNLDPDMPFVVKPNKDGISGGGSDHDSFIGAGVPAFFWNQTGRANYTETHHTQNDRFERAIPEYQQHSAIVIAVGALGIANLDHMLKREGVINKNRGGRGGGRMMGVQLADDGLTIEAVTEGGRAEKAGWKAGDKIVKVDGKTVSDNQTLREAIYTGEPRKTITIVRGGVEIETQFEWSPPSSETPPAPSNR